MITVTDLSLNYSGTPLFSHVDLQFLVAAGISSPPDRGRWRAAGSHACVHGREAATPQK